MLFVGQAGSLARQHGSQVAGFAAVTIVAVALIGGWAGLPLLSSWGLGFATVKPMMALCLAALGLALTHPGGDSFAIGLGVVAVAAFDLGHDSFGVEIGIGSLETSRTATLVQGAASFALPHATALGLVLAGGSLAMSRFERHRLAATMLGSLAGTVAVFVLLGFLSGILTPYSSASVSLPALPTAVGLLCVASGIVLRIGTVPALRKNLRGIVAGREKADDLPGDRERQLRIVTDTAPVAIAHCDTEARFKFVNRHYAERLGLTPEQVIGRRVPAVIGDRAWATLEPFFRECLAGKAVEFDVEVEMPYQTTDPQFTHCCYEPEWRQGKVVGLVAAITNITNLKRAEAALRESEATFRAMFDASSVGKIEVEPDSGRFLRANAAMCNFVGYTEAELLARTVFDIAHPADRDHAHELLRRMIAGESAVSDLEKRCIRKDGSAVWARVTANVVRDGSGRPLRYIAVIQDVNARKQAEQDLQASKERLQLAMDAAQLGLWQYDPLHRVFSGDTRSKEILAFPKKEAALEEIIKLIHPDDVERVLTALEARLDPVEPNRSPTEFRLRRRRDEVQWVETLGLAYYEGAGRERRAVSVVGTVADITERKEREEKEHLLMREINHRAKNMLSVVHAIARQTATKNPEDFVERFSERIQALSANHDLLVRNEWNGVEIEDLVRAQLAPFADLIGSRIAVLGPKLRLKAASAQAVGLVLHELATNAGKYGALSTDRGRVDVCWRIDADTLSMSWTERDGPLVSAPKRRGFGTMVMEAMAEHSMDGTVDLDYAPSGVMWRLSCPAPNALSAGNDRD
jgi:PAS domain S-box-containing protein